MVRQKHDGAQPAAPANDSDLRAEVDQLRQEIRRLRGVVGRLVVRLRDAGLLPDPQQSANATDALAAIRADCQSRAAPQHGANLTKSHAVPSV
jgi:hypothetical protein